MSRSAPLTTGMKKPLAGGDLALRIGAREELQELGRLLRRALGHQPAVDAAERLARVALAAGDGREREPAHLRRRRGPSCRRRCALRVEIQLPISVIAPLPSPNWPDDCGAVAPRKPGWNGCRSTSCLNSSPALTNDLVAEALGLAALRGLEGGLAADAHREYASSRSAAATCRRRRR